jgi:signal transduction histidine kinase
MEIDSVVHYFDADIYPSDCGLSILARDITEKKRAADLQRAQEEMKVQLAQAKELKLLGLLTSGVAHEVRNPLNAISVVIEALFQEIGEKEELMLYKEHIFTHVDRLKRLMQDLLELGKPIERSKVTRINLREILNETIDLYKSSGVHQNLQITVTIDSEEENLVVSGVPLKLQQVFMNVFDNAIHHSTPDCVINIRIYNEGMTSCIQISDRGSGVKPEHLDHIFEPFFTTRRKGTGLGLAIVKHILELTRPYWTEIL